MIRTTCRGVTLIETLVFITVIGIALVALVRVYAGAVQNSADPLIQTRALELAQAQLDDILSRKFDENTPTGGVPACGSSTGNACLGIVPDTDFDDVGDFAGQSITAANNYNLAVEVVEAGLELGLAADALARRATVTVTMPGGRTLQLSAYKSNF